MQKQLKKWGPQDVVVKLYPAAGSQYLCNKLSSITSIRMILSLKTSVVCKNTARPNSVAVLNVFIEQ